MNNIPNIEVTKKDIIRLRADAIILPAHASLCAGGGLSHYIHQKAGGELNKYCKNIYQERQTLQRPGTVIATPSYRLQVKGITHIFHLVSPVWKDGTHNEDTQLAQGYRNCFDLANELNIKSIAFPSVSTGLHRFPKERAATIVCNQLIQYLANHSTDANKVLEKIYFSCYDSQNFNIYTRFYEDYIKNTLNFV